MEKEVYGKSIDENFDALVVGVKVVGGVLTIVGSLTHEYRQGLRAQNRTEANRIKIALCPRLVLGQMKRRGRIR